MIEQKYYGVQEVILNKKVKSNFEAVIFSFEAAMGVQQNTSGDPKKSQI